MGFVKNFFASCLGALVALMLVFIFVIFFFASLTSDEVKVISDKSVLHLKLDVPITELEADDPFEDLLPGASKNIGLMQLKRMLAHAKSDSKIHGILLEADITFAGTATLQEIRASLQDFRSSGKWVIAFADNYTEDAHFLASAADRIYMSPHGMVEFNGLSIDVTFFKRFFDKVGIKPEVFRVGEFKSAVEPFLRDDLSEENKLQLNALLHDMLNSRLQRISESRDIDVSRLAELANGMLARNATQAVETGLIDSLIYMDELKAEIRDRLGLVATAEVPLVTYHDYQKTYVTANKSENEVAVIVIDGEILPGESTDGMVGSTTIRKAIQRARKSNAVKAIVVRVNSPGGAFQAADEMWREIMLAAQEKPVIASMGDYAASGGYYVAMPCDTIVALPTTITGSIGIYSVLFDLSGLLEDKIGITTEEVKTGEVGELITFTRPLTPLEREIWQTQTNALYEVFIRKAAMGRDMSIEELKRVASGRVWTGSQAEANNLVDIQGGFDDAVALAAGAANLGDDYKLQFYPEPKTTLEKLFGVVEDNARAFTRQPTMRDLLPLYKQWQHIKTYEGVQARMPLEFEIQ